jgi:hypothetical protein
MLRVGDKTHARIVNYAGLYVNFTGVSGGAEFQWIVRTAWP